MNPKDIIKLNVPLFIRLLEYAKEDAKTDMDLHKVTENIIQLASSGQVLGMQEYQMIVGDHDELNEDFLRMQELAGLKDEFQTIKVYEVYFGNDDFDKVFGFKDENTFESMKNNFPIEDIQVKKWANINVLPYEINNLNKKGFIEL